MSRSKPMRVLLIFLLLVGVVGGGLAYLVIARQPKLLLGKAEKLFREGRFPEAEGTANEAARRLDESGRQEAYWIAAQAAYGANRFDAVLSYLQEAPPSSAGRRSKAAMMEADCYFRLGDADRAEAALRKILEEEPANLAAHNKLAALLRIEGRSYEALPHLAQVLRSGGVQEDALLAALSTEAVYVADNDLQNAQVFLNAVPENPTPLLGRARRLAASQQYDEALSLLEAIVAARPRELAAQSVLGRLYMEIGDQEAFRDWLEEVVKIPGEHPGVWLVRGIWEQGQGRAEQAARCFWEALKLDPNLLAGNYLLAQQLSALGRAGDAEPFASRAANLTKLLDLSRTQLNPASMQEMLAVLIALGRTPEAEAWRRLAKDKQFELTSYKEPIPVFEGDSLTDPAQNPALDIDLSSYPLPDQNAAAAEPSQLVADPPVFRDVAETAGVRFEHYNGADPTGQRVYMFELSGGAAVVLDYDGDQWPDLYLTQGSEWPLRNDSQYRDRLYRNVGDGTFADVTEAAGLGDAGLTQSAAAGDLDNDGFPDLFVANLGRNRLYHNNGDGTFSEWELPADDSSTTWSSGCGFGDLNGDGFADIYVVNYLGGPEVFTRECLHNGKPAQCHPSLFPGVQDQLLLNQGDGSWSDRTDMIRADNGKGLGLVVADLDNDRDLDVFVANDSVPNFAFRNESESGELRLGENALLMGLAFDERGWEQACMGVAAGDADGDGLLDMFVTNFYQEANTLYRQAAEGVFVDATRAANLRDTSFLTMSWGTQFLDFELDGDLDLIIANGHLNDFRDEGKEYQMPTELHVNQGGRFQMVAADSLPEYFGRKHLGRSIARWDYDRDGREDLCVTHVDQPVAILHNETAAQGKSLVLELSAVTTARDATGAVVEVQCGELTSRRQLTAGDGFAAGNQRCLVFGLGPAEKIDRIAITWPSGSAQEIVGPQPGERWRVAEGRSAIRLP